MTYPSNSDDLPIRKLYDRWERFEDSRREMSDDLKELFAEGKASGHNPKAMRIAFAERYRQTHDDADKRAKRELQDEDVELYLAALAGVPARAREIIEEFPPVPSFVATSSGGSEYAYDAETGEVLDTSSLAKAAHAASRDDDVGEHQRSSESGIADAVEPGRRTHVSAERDRAPITEPVEGCLPADEAEPTQVEASSVPRKRQWKHSDPAHPDCLRPELCGGHSNIAVCQACREAATLGQVA